MKLPGIEFCLVCFIASDSLGRGEIVRVDGLPEPPFVWEGDHRAGPLAVLSRYPRFPIGELLALAPDWRWMTEREVASYGPWDRKPLGREIA